MNSVKKLICGVAVFALAAGLQAGTLYWQLANNAEGDYVALAVKNNDSGAVTYANLLDSDGGTVVGQIVTKADAMAYVQYADISSYTSGYSFYVEMLNLNGTALENGWTSSAMSYSDLSSYISAGGISAGSVNVWTASAYIPEPTSGLLLLVGGSLLALRRKRRA